MHIKHRFPLPSSYFYQSLLSSYIPSLSASPSFYNHYYTVYYNAAPPFSLPLLLLFLHLPLRCTHFYACSLLCAGALLATASRVSVCVHFFPSVFFTFLSVKTFFSSASLSRSSSIFLHAISLLFIFFLINCLWFFSLAASGILKIRKDEGNSDMQRIWI